MLKLVAMKYYMLAGCCLLLCNSVFPQETRNLLSEGYSMDAIGSNLVYDQSWVTFPSYYDRNSWETLPANIRAQYIEQGEPYLDYQWQYIPASLFLEFTRSGSREVMQIPYRKNRAALEALVMAELMEGQGRFMDKIVDGVFFYCEQTYWGMSAHLSLQEHGSGIPDVNDPTIDLGVGQIAASLAWIHYFFQEEFDKINTLISVRLKQEIRKKVLEPYYTREDMWWMGHRGGMVNNWNPWCNYNVLSCIALMEEDSTLRVLNVHKTMRSVDHFINYYKDDGGCEEGPGYWSHAGGKLFDYLELLYQISGGKIDIYSQPVVQNMGKYIYRAYIDGEYFINFADASAKIHSRPGVIYRYGKRINDPMMWGFGALLAQQHHWGTAPINGKIELALENIFGMDEILAAEPKTPYLGEFHLEGTQIMGARDQEGSNEGFYLAAKGGHNGESHNHNDVGSFILYYHGKPALIDVGVGTYTAKTFSSKRYEIWTMQSGYHNLPAINGVDQEAGRRYKAGPINYKATNRKVEYTVDIAPAYPESAGVDQWQRTYTLNRGKGLIVSDEYLLKQDHGGTRLNFMTDLDCEIVDPGTIDLKGDDFVLRMKYDGEMMEASVERIDIDDARLQRAWGEGIFRLKLEFKDSGTAGKTQVEIVRL